MSVEGRLDALEKGQDELRAHQETMAADVHELKRGQELLRDGQTMLQKRVNSMELKIDHLGFDMAQVLFNATTAMDEALARKQEKTL